MATGKLKKAVDVNNDTDWQIIYGTYCRVKLVNGVVTVKGESNGGLNIGSHNNYVDLTTLPAKYRPTQYVWGNASFESFTGTVRITPAGIVQFLFPSAQSYWLYTITYVL